MRPDADALEAFYLCVMLGFQGELRADPQQLHSWSSAAQTRVAPVRGREWKSPPENDPSTNVPPLRGRDSFQQMVLIGGGLLLLLMPVLAFLMVRKVNQ
jgi:type VI protein secretion system component VasF